METYIVLYRPPYLGPIAAPMGFCCDADDPDHAEEQCANAYPDADIVWVWQGGELRDALHDYWTISDFEEA